MKTKFAIAMFIVSFFLALGLVRAQDENVQPEAYASRVLPGVMIIMQHGNTVSGTCLQIETDGNLPVERVKNFWQCTKMVAENHTGLTGEAALEATKKIREGEAVFFPFKTTEAIASAAEIQVQDKVIEEKNQEISTLNTQNGELKSAFDSVSEELKIKTAEFKAEMKKINAEVERIRLENSKQASQIEELASQKNIAEEDRVWQASVISDLERELAVAKALAASLETQVVDQMVLLGYCLVVVSLVLWTLMRQRRKIDMLAEINKANDRRHLADMSDIARVKSELAILPEYHEQGGRKFRVCVIDTTPGAKEDPISPKNLRQYLNKQVTGGHEFFELFN